MARVPKASIFAFSAIALERKNQLRLSQKGFPSEKPVKKKNTMVSQRWTMCSALVTAQSLRDFYLITALGNVRRLPYCVIRP